MTTHSLLATLGNKISHLVCILSRPSVALCVGGQLFIVYCLLFIAPPGAKAYRVGVAYHATTDNFQESAFIQQYQNPTVRATVISQLQSMANSGVEVISTRIWLTDPPSNNFPNNHERLGFPITPQQTANLKLYVEDVSIIKNPSGKYLDLYIIPLGMGCAGYNGEWCNYTWDQTLYYYKQSFNDIFTATGNITRPDGKKAVTVMYMMGEVMINSQDRRNEDKFLLEVYPYFVSLANQYGITPSVYFMTNQLEDQIIDNGYRDPKYEILNQHESLYWLYYATEFMKNNNLPIPTRLDISFYPKPANYNYEDLVKRVFDDIAAIYPNIQIGIAEGPYPATLAKRQELGNAFKNEALRRDILQEFIFWTTPGSGENGENAGSPFDIASFLPEISPTAPTNLAVSGNTITWIPGAGNHPQYLRVGTDQATVIAGCLNGIGGTTGCLYKSDALPATQNTITLPTALLPNTLYYWRVVNSDSGTMKDAIISANSAGTTRNPADISGPNGTPDNVVDAYDYTPIATDYGKTGAPGFSVADISGDKGIPDGTVSMYDYSFFVSNFGK